MYRFVLLSIGFNLNKVYLYLTFSPSVWVCLLLLHCADGAFQEEVSVQSVRACVIAPVAALKQKQQMFYVPHLLLIPSDDGTVY